MAKSLRSKREKRLRAIRREMVEPYYDKKEAAKLAALEAALSAPKLLVKPSPFAASASSSMDLTSSNPDMDIEMADDKRMKSSLKPMGKKLKKKFKLAKNKRHGKGKIKRNHI